jgi:hypothetical protein
VQLKIWVGPVRQGLIYTVYELRKVFVAVVTHAGKTCGFLFIAISTLLTGPVIQHVTTHFTHGLIIPDLTHAFFFEIAHWMFGYSQATRISTTVGPSM